jgi:hypothetical protein
MQSSRRLIVEKMADDRVSRKTAEGVPLAPHTWYVKKINWLLEQPAVKENITRVPLNEPLIESLSQHGMKSPILVMPSWYPIAGSQRMRAYREIVIADPIMGEQEIFVCRFDQEWWLQWYLWPDKEFRDKAVAIWFQMAELVWKSRYYIDEFDPGGIKMRMFEKLGDELEWKHKTKQTDSVIKSKQPKNKT